jgi:hypothetical protein
VGKATFHLSAVPSGRFAQKRAHGLHGAPAPSASRRLAGVPLPAAAVSVILPKFSPRYCGPKPVMLITGVITPRPSTWARAVVGAPATTKCADMSTHGGILDRIGAGGAHHIIGKFKPLVLGEIRAAGDTDIALSCDPAVKIA